MHKTKEGIKTAFAEYWNSIIENFPNLVIGLALFTVILIVGLTLRRITKKQLRKRMDDLLLINFIDRTLMIFTVVVGLVIFMGHLGWGQAAGGLLAGAGVTALILGFAFKDIGENFIAGFFLAFSRPFNIGDRIEILDVIGNVERMSFRNTHLRTLDGKDVFIPNAILIKDKLINYTRDGLLRHSFVIGLDYSSDVKEAVKSIVRTISSIGEIDQSELRKPMAMIKEFGTSTVNIEIFYWTNEDLFKGSLGALKTKVMNVILRKLQEEGYEMPADLIELKIYNKNHPIPIEMSQKERVATP